MKIFLQILKIIYGKLSETLRKFYRKVMKILEESYKNF